MENILIKCEGRNFVKDKAVCDRIMTLEEVLDLCEELYNETERLNEKIDDLEQDIEDNYIPVSKSEQYGISNSDFI
jgi:hypothetical protein